MSDDAPTGGAISRSELKEATFTSLRWATVARIAAEGVSLSAGVLLAHLVPPDQFGRVAVTIVVSELALALANQGAGSVLVQRKVLDHAHVQATALLALVVGLALTVATLVLSPLLAAPLFGEETANLFQLLSPAFTIASIGIVPLAMLERRLDFRRISMIEIATVLVGSTASVVLALLGLEAEAYVLGFVIGLMVWATLLLIVGPSARPRWHRRELAEITGFGVPAGLASVAMVGYGNVDYLILGAKLSPAQVGFYYRAYTLGVQYETKISDIIARLAFPVYSRTENVDHMREVRSRVVRINATVIYPILALFIALAPEVVPWLFGQRWEPAVLPAQILAVAGMARMINNGTPPLLLAAGRPRTLLAFNLCRLGVLAAAVFVAASYGLIAVCVTVAAFQVGTLLASYALMLSRVVGVTLRQLSLDLAPALASSAMMLAIAFPLTRAVVAGGATSPITIAVVSALCAPIYLLALRLVSPAAWSDLMLLTRKLLRRGERHKASESARKVSHPPIVDVGKATADPSRGVAVPTTIYVDSAIEDEQRREKLYGGSLFTYSAGDDALGLAGLARDLSEAAFAPHEPTVAQESMSPQRYVDILAQLKPTFIHHPVAKELIAGLLGDLGCDLDKTYFDVPRLRTMAHGEYLNAGLAYQFHPHRDTWFSAPQQQLNWWLPVYEIESENSMAFHPQFFDTPVRNSSASYDYDVWNKTGRKQAAKQVTTETRKQPEAEETLDLSHDVRVVTPPGGVLVFSAAQLHSTVPNTTDRTRFSIDFRTVNRDDLIEGVGAPNLDSECTGTTLGDFLRASDLEPLPEEIIAAHGGSRQPVAAAAV